MYKKVYIFTVLICMCVALAALEVDTTELETVSDTDIVFIDYTGPVGVINTFAQIQGIGSDLGRLIAQGQTESGSAARYYIIHAIDSAEKKGLDADIFILGNSAGVDQISNLRLIIAGYLTSLYGYTTKDAQTLSNFITVYNAVYRGNLPVYQAKYKPIVLNNLTADKVGLSINYVDWAGKTQIVIPLSISGLSDSLSAIDTSIISDKAVIDSLREQNGMGIGDRKDLVDLKERESEQAQQRAAEAQKQAVEAQKQVQTEKTVLATEEVALKKTQEEAKSAQGTPAEAQKRAEVVQQEQKVAEQKEALVQAEEKALTATEQATQEQQRADKKQSEAQADRIEIAKDQQQVIKEQQNDLKNPVVGKITLLITEPNNMLSSLVLVDPVSGKILQTSALNSIRDRTILSAGTNYIGIAGKSGGNAVIKLVLLNGETFDLITQSEELLTEKAALVSSGSSYYTTIQSGTDYIIARYNENLELLNTSSLAVLPETAITVTDSGLLVQTPTNEVKLLRLTDLTDITASR